MRDAEKVLEIIRSRGERGLPLEDVYRQLYNPDLYLRAYGRLYRNAGAMTRGVTEETVDGMSLRKINALIEAIRFERFRWTPVRRILIPKANGKMRPLGIPTWSDKVLQEVMRSILEAYYEPRFSPQSHGFRPQRGCHTALMQLQRNWTGVKWFIEGDIKGFFDNIDHAIMLTILREKIRDNRFLRLVEGLLTAGYLEEWNFRPTHSGTPQGGVISPILSNIYLDKLDQFVEKDLIPRFTRGKLRKSHRQYYLLNARVTNHIKVGKLEKANELRRLRDQFPCSDPMDPGYRRLRYVRYADDFILGYVGTKSESETIKGEIRDFLRDHLNLELSDEKTLITNAKTEKARFLGYDIGTMYNDTRRAVNNRIDLRLPLSVLGSACRRYYKGDKVHHRPELVKDSDFDIVTRFGQEYRGFVHYYAYASNRFWCRQLRWVARSSLLKTLANKHRSSVARMSKLYTNKLIAKNGLVYRCLQVVIQREGKEPLVATFGGIPLVREWRVDLMDGPVDLTQISRTELVQRLLADECEYCGGRDKVEVHHVRKLADLNTKGRKSLPTYKKMMIARKRKTLVLCEKCHDDLHAGRLDGRLVVHDGT